MENPYKVIREEKTERREDDTRILDTVGYDSQGRIVMRSSETFNDDGTKGPTFCQVVEEDGFWHGGISAGYVNGKLMPGCQLAAQKFVEEADQLIKNNAHIQALADREAAECGYFCATYEGRISEPCVIGLADYTGPTFVYTARRNDSRIYIEGLPCVIIVQGEHVLSVQEIPLSIDILSQVKRRYRFDKGKRIFDRYVEKVDKHDFDNQDEEQYITEIVNACSQYSYDTAIELPVMYEFLEIAARFDKKINISPDPDTMDRNDGWEYYLEVVDKE